MSAHLVHIVADLEGIAQGLLDDSERLIQVLEYSARRAGLSPLTSWVYKFQPSGVSAVLIISESHISIHTWPEDSFAALDILSCSDQASALKTLDLIRQQLSPTNVQVKTIERGHAAIQKGRLQRRLQGSNEHG